MLQGLQTANVEPWRYRIVPVDEACERTGLEVEQLLCLPGVQTLTREFADGRREKALRLPVELASAHPVPAPAVNSLPSVHVRSRSEQGVNRQR
jgi:hypothetical protein